MKALKLYALLLFVCVCASCKKDDYVYPEVQTEFIGLRTDASGTGVQLLSDKGDTYRIQARDGLSGLVADTVYRTVSVYSRLAGDADSDVKLYSCSLVLSLEPIEAKSLKEGVKTDPVDIQSMWRSGDYLNMVLLVPVKETKHLFHFIDEGITEEGGVRTLHLRLYHDSAGDYAAFTRRSYLSVPLWCYADRLRFGDKVRFALNTDKEGETYRDFDF